MALRSELLLLLLLLLLISILLLPLLWIDAVVDCVLLLLIGGLVLLILPSHLFLNLSKIDGIIFYHCRNNSPIYYPYFIAIDMMRLPSMRPRDT